MARNREKQTITSEDVGTLVLTTNTHNTHGVNKGEKHKCSICGQEYTIHDPKNPNFHKTQRGSRQLFRFPDEWNESDIMAHKISHVKLPKAKRILSMFIKLSKDDREETLDFINEHFAG